MADFARALIPIAGIAMVLLLVWYGERRKEREFFHRTELLRKVAESPADAAQPVPAMLRKQEHLAQVRRLEGLKLGGLITLAAGFGLMTATAMLVPGTSYWIVGLIPVLVGAVLTAYVYWLAPKPDRLL